MRAKQRTQTFPDKWKLIYTERTDFPLHHMRIAEAMRLYMISHDKHNIQDLECVVMNQYEEEICMNRMVEGSIKFRWVCIAKQHQPPYSERFAFSIYSWKQLMSVVFEPCIFNGRVVERRDYRAK